MVDDGKIVLSVKFNGSLLKELRKGIGLTQAKFDDMEGFDDGCTGRLELGGYKNPTINIVKRVAHVFRRPVDDFLIVEYDQLYTTPPEHIMPQVEETDIGAKETEPVEELPSLHGENDRVTRFDDIEVNHTNRKVYRGGEFVLGGRAAFRVLEALIDNINDVATKSSIMRKVWGDSWSWKDENSLRVHISVLRRAIGKDYVQNISCLGYKLATQDHVEEEQVLDKVTKLGVLEINHTAKVITMEGIEVISYLLVFRLVEMLGRNPDELISREALMEHLWGSEDAVEYNQLNAVVAHARKALGADRIINVPRQGYRLVTDTDMVIKDEAGGVLYGKECPRCNEPSRLESFTTAGGVLSPICLECREKDGGDERSVVNDDWKTCLACDLKKHPDDFSRHRTNDDGLKDRCKECETKQKEEAALAEKPSKVCTKCGETKILDDFHSTKVSKDGKTSQCRKCLNKHSEGHARKVARNHAWNKLDVDTIVAEGRLQYGEMVFTIDNKTTISMKEGSNYKERVTKFIERAVNDESDGAKTPDNINIGKRKR